MFTGKTKAIFYVCCYFIILSLHGQHTPIITNYKATEYKAHHQNWSVTQAWNRKVFAANTFGLLSFDGNRWDLDKLKSNKLLRSVFARGERIYSGAFEEIGFWQEDACGRMHFHDLTSLVDGRLIKNEEFWHITAHGHSIFFQSFSVLLAYNGKKIMPVTVPGSIMFLYFIGDTGYVQALEHGIYSIDKNLKTTLLPNTAFFRDKTITGIHPYQDPHTLLITTNSDGIFLYKNGVISAWRPDLKKYFSTAQINKTLITSERRIVLGTIRDGVLIFSHDGTLKYHINTSNGLQNNTVLSMVEDRENNIWLGLDKGISRIEMSEEILQFRDIGGLIGSVYTIATMDSILYLGTNQGVYYHDMKAGVTPESKASFNLVEGSQGQVWQLFPLDKEIFCGHNSGSLLIKGTKSHKISDITGGWFNEFIPGTNRQLLLQGNYTGLCVFRYVDKSLKFSHRIQGFTEPVKKFIFDNGYLWVCNPNSGIRRISLDATFSSAKVIKSYNNKDGLTQKNNLDLVRFRNKIMVWDGENHLYYDTKKDRFITDKKLNKYDKGFLIRPLDGNNWLRIYHDKAVRMSGETPKEQIPYLFNRDYHNAIELNPDQFALCLDDGYIIQNRTSDPATKMASQNAISIRILNKEGNCILPKNNKSIKIPFQENDISIRFYDLDYRAGKNYYYRLIPGTAQWKQIDNIGQIDFNNLQSGNYLIEIQRDDHAYGKSHFIIQKPWYLSIPAILFYLILLIILIYAVNRYYSKKMKNTKDKMLAERNRLIRQHEMEIENQQLLNENLFKNKELANVTMHLIQKNETLQDIREELLQLKHQPDQKHLSRDFQIILKQINQNLNQEADKKLFDTSFDKVHETFLKELKRIFPNLSREDLKLAAFLRMNLTSKEIAPLFNISLRGLENKRYRLRKKLKIESDQTLIDFFNSILKEP